MKTRKCYIDILRVIASFAVVLIHVTVSYIDDYSADTSQWAILNLFNSLSRWSVPVFVMISGAVTLGKGLYAQ